MLRIYLTGEVQVENGARLLRESQLGGPQGRFVFAYLVTERKQALAQSDLAEALWPESLPASWTLALSAIVSRLRARLGGVGLPRARVIGNAFGCYQFTPPGEAWVDVEAALAGLDAAEGAIAAGNPRVAYGPSLIATLILRRPFLLGQEERPPKDKGGDERRPIRHSRIAGSDCALRRIEACERGFDIDPCLAWRRELIAAKGVADDASARQADAAESRAEPADDGAQREGPGGRQRFWPQSFGQVGLRHRLFALGDEVGEDEPPLRAAELRLAQQAGAVFDLHLPRQVDPQHRSDSADNRQRDGRLEHVLRYRCRQRGHAGRTPVHRDPAPPWRIRGPQEPMGCFGPEHADHSGHCVRHVARFLDPVAESPGSWRSRFGSRRVRNLEDGLDLVAGIPAPR